MPGMRHQDALPSPPGGGGLAGRAQPWRFQGLGPRSWALASQVKLEKPGLKVGLKEASQQGRSAMPGKELSAKGCGAALPAVSLRARGVPPFLVMDVMEAAAALEAKGERVIHMEVGQPATPAPQAALAA